MAKYKQPNAIYSLLSRGSKVLDKLVGSRKRLFVILIAVFGFLFIIQNFRSVFFSALLVILGAVSLIHSRYIKYSHYLGFELCMMATVLSSLKYGPHAGATVAFLSITGGLILSGSFKHSSFISVIVLPVMGLITPLFDLELPLLGVVITVIYDIIILPMYIMLGSRIWSSAIFFLTHVMFNYWIFSTIAPLLFRIM